MKFTLQELYDGLNGANFRYYVNLINSTLHGELDNYDEWYWMPNDEYSLDMIMEGLHWTTFELLRNARNYNPDDDFVRVNGYNDLETISYEGLADFYEKLLFDEEYLNLLNDLLEED